MQWRYNLFIRIAKIVVKKKRFRKREATVVDYRNRNKTKKHGSFLFYYTYNATQRHYTPYHNLFMHYICVLCLYIFSLSFLFAKQHSCLCLHSHYLRLCPEKMNSAKTKTKYGKLYNKYALIAINNATNT